MQEHQWGERLKTHSQTSVIFTSSGDNPAHHSAQDGLRKIWGNEGRRKPSNHFPTSATAPILHCILIFLQDWSQLLLSCHCPAQVPGKTCSYTTHKAALLKASEVNKATKICGTCFTSAGICASLMSTYFSLYRYFKWFCSKRAIKTRDKGYEMQKISHETKHDQVV